MRAIRHDPAGPEAWCPYCREFYPLTLEYWALKSNLNFRLDRCRLCQRERGRLYQALRRRDPAFNESERVRHRNYYRQWIAKKHPDLLPVYDRERLDRERRMAVNTRVRRAA